MGKVGFLSNIPVDNIENNLEKLISGQYKLTEKMILQAEIIRNGECIDICYAVNEIVIKAKQAKLTSLLFSVDSNKVGQLRGDGVIIATPAGSTAYSFSAGGPIVDSDLPAFVVSLLSSYYLHHRPLVIEAGKTLELEVVQDGGNVLCIDGGQDTPLRQKDCIVVRKANMSLKLIDLGQDNSFWSGIYNRVGRNLSV